METVEDIVAMLRRFARGEETVGDHFPSFTSLVDRIEAAHKNDTDQVVHLLTNSVEQEKRIENLRLEYVEQRKKIQQLEQENTRLKSALKPVLECDTDGITLNFEEDQIVGGHDVAIAAVDAVYNAKKVYNEGGDGHGNT